MYAYVDDDIGPLQTRCLVWLYDSKDYLRI